MIEDSNRGDLLFDPFNDRKFNELFDKLYVPLCRYCCKLVNDPVAAEDIVQEQFIYLWENKKRLATISSPDAYLYTSVKNKSINCIKKQFRKRLTTSIEESYELSLESVSPSVSELLDNKELITILEKAVESLPVKCRTIFTLKKIAGLTNKELAGSLGISVKTVEAQMTIAIKKITAFLSKYGYLILLVFILQ